MQTPQNCREFRRRDHHEAGCVDAQLIDLQCSLERPSCVQCTRTGRVCLGYQKECVFVSSSTSSALAKATWRPDEYRKSISTAPKSSESQDSLNLAGESLCYHVFLENSAHRQQLMSNFLSRFLIYNKKVGKWETPMLGMITEISSPPKILEFAMYALCTLRLGRADDPVNNTLLHSSRQLYGRAIHSMYRVLSDPTVALTDETLAACVTLAMYELFECTTNGRSGYDSHYEGCARLVQLRGPKAHKSGLGHSSFCAFRTMGVSRFHTMHVIILLCSLGLTLISRPLRVSVARTPS
jgi:hypothetical protein